MLAPINEEIIINKTEFDELMIELKKLRELVKETADEINVLERKLKNLINEK